MTIETDTPNYREVVLTTLNQSITLKTTHKEDFKVLTNLAIDVLEYIKKFDSI